MPEIENIHLHLPKNYEDNIKIIREEYLKNNYALISLEGLADQYEADKLKDYLIGMSWSKGGMIFQFKEMMLFILHPDIQPYKLKGFIFEDNKGGK